MAAYLVILEADEMVPLAVYADAHLAERFREKLLKHYGIGGDSFWEQLGHDDPPHESSVQGVLDKADLIASSVYGVKVFEFDSFGGFRREVPRAAGHPEGGDGPVLVGA